MKIFLTEQQILNIKNSISESKKQSYVNMNVSLRKGGRNAVKMSVDDFKREMEHTYHEYCIEQNVDVTYSCHRQASVGHFIYSCCYGSKTNSKSKIVKDLYNDIWGGKYKFDSENVDNRGDIKMSSKGFPYIEAHAGGDWECPVCFFVYFDGNKFRGYVPLKGNAICRDNNSAFGNDYYKEDSTEITFLKKEFGVKTKDGLPVVPTDINSNVDACLEDFLSRVEIKGSYKKRDYTKDNEKFEEFKKKKKEEKEKKDSEREQKHTTTPLDVIDMDLLEEKIDMHDNVLNPIAGQGGAYVNKTYKLSPSHGNVQGMYTNNGYRGQSDVAYSKYRTELGKRKDMGDVARKEQQINAQNTGKGAYKISSPSSRYATTSQQDPLTSAYHEYRRENGLENTGEAVWIGDLQSVVGGGALPKAIMSHYGNKSLYYAIEGGTLKSFLGLRAQSGNVATNINNANNAKKALNLMIKTNPKIAFIAFGCNGIDGFEQIVQMFHNVGTKVILIKMFQTEKNNNAQSIRIYSKLNGLVDGSVDLTGLDVAKDRDGVRMLQSECGKVASEILRRL